MDEMQANEIIALLTSIDQKLELMVSAVLAPTHDLEPAAPLVTSWDDVPGPSIGAQVQRG